MCEGWGKRGDKERERGGGEKEGKREHQYLQLAMGHANEIEMNSNQKAVKKKQY